MLMPHAIASARQRVKWVTPVFSPDTSLANLVAWFDFSDISTLFQDESRTTPVTTDSQNIRGVADKSGNANHMSRPARSTADVTYVASGQNGLSHGSWATDLDRGLYMESSIDASIGTGCIIVGVQQVNGTTQTNSRQCCIIDEGAVSDTTEWFLTSNYVAGTMSRWCNSKWEQYTSSPDPPAGAYLWRVHIPNVGAAGKYVQSGVDYTESAVLNSHDGFDLFGIGEGTFSSGFLGTTQEIIVCSSMTAEEISGLETYLKDKWAVT